MKKKLIVVAAIVLSSVMLTGCSSILNGSTQKVEVNTKVQDLKAVRLYRDGVLVAEGKNAISNFTLDRKSEYMIDVVNTKGESHKLHLNKNLTTSFLIGNFFFGGIPGWVIDYISGSAYKFSGESTETTVTTVK